MLRLIVVGTLAAFTASALRAQEEKPVKPTEGVEAPTPGIVTGPLLPKPDEGVPRGGNSWFPGTDLDLGTFFGAEHATGVFKFRNPLEEEVIWQGLYGSCTCAKAVVRVGGRTYELSSKPRPNVLTRIEQGADGQTITEEVKQIAIGPGEAGEIEVHLEIPNAPGPRMAYLDVHTTDPHLRQFKLKWTATSAQLFVLSPKEINLNKMSWNETREFTATVTSPLHPDFEILSMEGGSDAFDVSWSKRMEGDRAIWTIQGKYGPVGDDVSGGGLLKFVSNVRGRSTFTLRVMALVEGPLTLKPGGFLALGMVRSGKEAIKQVVFEPNDGTKLVAKNISFDKLTVADEFVFVRSHNEGNSLVVELGVSAKAPRGLLRGDLVVELDHPLVKEKRILFNGYVR